MTNEFTNDTDELEKFRGCFQLNFPDVFTQRMHEKYQQRLKAISGKDPVISVYRRKIVEVGLEMQWVFWRDSDKIVTKEDLLDASPLDIMSLSDEIFDAILEATTLPNS